jgi:lipid-A-disaccharide synthase
MVVVYKVAAVTGFLARKLIRVKNVSLVNLLAGETVVVELLQEEAEPQRLAGETLRLLEKKQVRDKQLKAFEQIRKNISKPPKASRMAAGEILKMLAVKD